MKIGLTLMKIAPLHKGHVFLIESALKIVDELIIVVYDCPDITSIPLTRRCNWIRELFPQRVTVIEGYDAPNVHENTEEVKRLQEKYIGSLVADKKISHFFSSEYYGDHMSNYLGSVNSIIDLDRVTIPISSTKIRNNFLENSDYLPQPVLNDLFIPRMLIMPPKDSSRNLVSQKLLEFHMGELLPQRYSFDKLVASRAGFNEERSMILSRGGTADGHKMTFETCPAVSVHILNVVLYREFDPRLFKKAQEELSFYEDVVLDRELFSMSKDDGISDYFHRAMAAHLATFGKYFRYVDNYRNML